jgi:hypothetical protein
MKIHKSLCANQSVLLIYRQTYLKTLEILKMYSNRQMAVCTDRNLTAFRVFINCCLA